MNRFENWLESIYDFLFILAITLFGYIVQIGYMYIKDKTIGRKKVFVLFLINLSISYFLNKLLVKVGWADWVWLGVWFYNANSIWLLEVIGKKFKRGIEKAVPSIVESWSEKLKPKDTEDDNTNS